MRAGRPHQGIRGGRAEGGSKQGEGQTCCCTRAAGHPMQMEMDGEIRVPRCWQLSGSGRAQDKETCHAIEVCLNGKQQEAPSKPFPNLRLPVPNSTNYRKGWALP